MIKLEIEELNRENEHLIRTCQVKINGSTFYTPTKTIGIGIKGIEEFQITKKLVNPEVKTLGEVYVKTSLSELNTYIENDDEGKRFSSKLSDRVSQLKEIGSVPYILFSITDDSGVPYNQMLPDKAMEFLFNILWGTFGNSIIATPLLGTLRSSDQYEKLIDAFHTRQQNSIDRKNQPIMAIIPSSYNLVDPHLLEKYWNIGCRIFGYNCENKKYGAYSYILERMHNTLSKLSKLENEHYIVNALNSKLKVGKSDSSRIHNLIGTGYGFDCYSPNHIRAFSNTGEPQRMFIFNSNDYGYVNIDDLVAKREFDSILSSNAFKKIDLSEIPILNEKERRILCQRHNIEKISEEINKYSNFIENNKFLDYLSNKNKIKPEKSEIESFHLGTFTSSLDEWWSNG